MKDEIIAELKEGVGRSIEALRKEFSRIRTGRASAALLEGIRVNCYSSLMPLDQVASISVPESRLITIKPWDQAIIGEVEKSILRSELGLTPMNDGKIIRISIPPLTEERRKELAKLARKMAEDCKIAVRNHRREANESLKELKSEKEMSEDEMFRAQDDVQKLTDNYIKQVDAITAEKEKEIIKAQLTGKPAQAAEKIIEGKLAKFYEDACLMEQPFVKDPSLKVKDVVAAKIGTIGENIIVRKFVRFQVGDET